MDRYVILFKIIPRLSMNFLHQQHYGKDLFYPNDDKAKKFVEAFPHSSGKRKSLTTDQMHILKDVGVHFNVRENSTPQQQNGEYNVITGDNRL